MPTTFETDEGASAMSDHAMSDDAPTGPTSRFVSLLKTVALVVSILAAIPTAITVSAGTPVTFVLRNDDPIDHEWIVGDAAVHARHRTGTEPVHGARPTELSIPAGATRETTIRFDTPGTYLYICHLPGHEAYGMVGTLVVTGS